MLLGVRGQLRQDIYVLEYWANSFAKPHLADTFILCDHKSRWEVDDRSRTKVYCRFGVVGSLCHFGNRSRVSRYAVFQRSSVLYDIVKERDSWISYIIDTV